MNNIKLLYAKPEGDIEFELEIAPYYANLNGVMHGGAAGVIFDMCTTTALGPLSKKGFWEYMLLPFSLPPTKTFCAAYPMQSALESKYRVHTNTNPASWVA